MGCATGEIELGMANDHQVIFTSIIFFVHNE